MSKYTGKEVCVYSEFYMFDKTDIPLEERLKKVTIYLKDKVLDIKTERQLVPYYANMVGAMGCTNEDGIFRRTIHISSLPYFLSEDWGKVDRMYRDLQKFWKRCKRQGIEFTLDYVKEHFWYDDEPCLEGMFKEIKEHPYAKLVRGKYHSRFMQHYRDELVKTMKEFNYTEDEINEWVWNGKRTWM